MNKLSKKKTKKFSPRNSNGGTTSRAFSNGKIVQLEKSKQGFEFGGTVMIPSLLPETKIGLEFNHDKQSDDSPDFLVHRPVSGREGVYWAHCGSCWIKEPKKGGDDYLSFSLQFPDIGKRINMQAFRADKEHQPNDYDGKSFPPVWSMVFSLPRAGASNAAKPYTPEPLDDNIEF